MRPGQRTDVRAPVTADLRLVPHAAERDPHELASGGARDRLAERRLADARRTDQREDQATAAPSGLVRVVEPAVGAQLAHRQVLHDAVLHVAQTGVVRVEDAARLGDVHPLLGALTPRQLEDRVDPRADPAVLGALLGRALELVDLLR